MGKEKTLTLYLHVNGEHRGALSGLPPIVAQPMGTMRSEAYPRTFDHRGTLMGEWFWLRNLCAEGTRRAFEDVQPNGVYEVRATFEVIRKLDESEIEIGPAPVHE